MDFATLVATLVAAYKNREAGEDRQDAFVDAVMPEVAKYFAALFKEGDADGIFASLNKLILGVYALAPDALQFIIRLLANLGVEKMQGTWPAWASLPLMVFVKGYFNALEEATRGKAKPTTQDVKDALNDAARKARDAASDLGKKFKAARDAAPHITIPPTNPRPPEGPDMSDSRTPNGPAAGGTGKKSAAERVEELKDNLSVLANFCSWAADRGEDHTQSAANGGFWAIIAMIATATTTILAGFSSASTPMSLNVAFWAVFWVFGPFIGLWRWRDHNRRIHAKEMAEAEAENPYEQAGNGWLELGALAGATAFVGLVSTLVVAAMCALASYTHFHAAYVWMGLIAIGAGFFAWVFTDAGIDTLRAIGQVVVPDERESLMLKARGRTVRSFALVGVIYCLIMAYPVLLYVVAHTDYTGSTAMLGLFLGLVAGFANTRLGSEASIATAASVAEIHAAYTRRNYETAQRMLLWTVGTIALFVAIDFVIFPPTCPDNAGASILECTAELPSYAERMTVTEGKDAEGKEHQKVRGLGQQLVSTLSGNSEGSDADNGNTPAATCSAQVVAFVNGIEKNDCKVIFENSENAKVIGACKKAVACGALNENGVKMPRSKSPKRAAAIDSPVSFGSGWCVAGSAITVLVLVWLAWLGRKKPEEKKSGASAAH